VSKQKRSTKKEQFTRKQKSNLPIIMGITFVLVAAVFVYLQSNTRGQAEGSYFGDPVAAPRSYMGEFVSMTSVEPIVEEGRIEIPLEEVAENNIVYFEIANDEGFLVPLMAYITPSGRLFAGSSMCEPCGGRTFSLAGETLVCDTCRTTYTIEDHQFLSGSRACGSYPPVNMNPVLKDGMVVIDLQEVLNWRIRA
jgi:hypothetical protein